jgi:S1-C subfamily serine protease
VNTGSTVGFVHRAMSQLSGAQIFSVALLDVALVLVPDYLTGVEISPSVFYLCPVRVAPWYAGRKTGAPIAFISPTWLPVLEGPMRLDSVRELKQSLPAQLNKMFAVRAAAGRTASLAVASAASLGREAPSYFLGVSARGKKNYRLAVRLQDRALERSELVARIAARAKGEVDVRYVGRIRARATPWYRSKQRPLLIGSSTGFLASGFIMAGTLGCFVRSGSPSALYILSNNHVLADENRYPKGGAIVQPGALDGGSPAADRVAKLTRFVRLDPAKTNFVDGAIAKLNAAIQADVHRLRGIGTLAGQRSSDLQVGDVVRKVGRTTGVRHGRVTAFELDGVAVEYDIGIVSFDNQIEIEGAGSRSFSDAGDSGSLIVDAQMRAAALLFAGGDHGGSNGKGLTYANPIAAVLRALKVKLA